MPYIVFAACTILLLAPEDPAAMDGVRTCLACLDGMDETGYWVESARDSARRVRALAHRWGVTLESSRRILGLAGAGNERKTQRSSSPMKNNPPVCWDASTGPAGAHTSQALEPVSHEVPRHSILPTGNACISQLGHNGLDVPANKYPSPEAVEAVFAETLDPGVNQALSEFQRPQDHGSTIMNLPDCSFHLPTEQMWNNAYIPLSSQQPDLHLAIQHQTLLQRGLESTTLHRFEQKLPRSLPHVAYASSHADPQHDMNIPHSHWHNIIPPADLDLLFPPDPSTCADMGTCFNYTVEHAQDPAFIDLLIDPHLDLPMDWAEDGGLDFPGCGGLTTGLPSTSVGELEESFGQGGRNGSIGH